MDREKLDLLLQERPIPLKMVIKSMAELAYLANPDDLSAISEIAKTKDTPLDLKLTVPAMALFPAWGKMGIKELKKFAIKGPHGSSALNILATIAYGEKPSSKSIMFLDNYWDEISTYHLPDEIQLLAQRELRAALLEQISNEISQHKLIWNISSISFGSAVAIKEGSTVKAEIWNYIFDLLIDSRLILNESVLLQFEELLNSEPDREERLQQFLVTHPVLLDPYITELRSKHELGDDFITDFVIRRINNDHVLVEIENSTDKLFRKDGSFTSSLMQAIAQVRDFQAWIGNNLAYAQKKLPEIRHPNGLVIIGRRIDLSPIMVTRLDEENFSRRGHIKIMTYDDLLFQAKAVYRNILEKPLVLKSKDQRTL